MFIDKYLNWNHHITNLSKQLSRANGVLSKLRYNASLEFCLQVYYAIFHSHLTYGCNLWGFTSEENICKLEVLQNKCVSIISFAPFNSSTNEIFIELGLLKVRDLISLNQLKLVYDFIENNLPSDLMSLFNFCSEAHSVPREFNSTVNKLNYIPRVKTTIYGIDSIRYHCATLWNKFFKEGEINVDDDKKNNVKLLRIQNRKSFNLISKKHFFQFIHYYSRCYFLLRLLITVVFLITKMLH